ncbi:hypothetical protein BN177_520028 [Clostridioides difficile E24]|nr:hypothetical protein BN177_520028 [Clostridioides difficile E24]CCL47473.1 hypothetical protein BN178_760026 [Clostridioides difficile T42]
MAFFDISISILIHSPIPIILPIINPIILIPPVYYFLFSNTCFNTALKIEIPNITPLVNSSIVIFYLLS